MICPECGNTEFKKEYKSEYSMIQASMADAAIKKHVDSFNGFVELKNLKIDGKYKGKVNKPKKHDNYRLHNLIIQKGSITSSKKKLAEGYIELPLSREYKKELESKYGKYGTNSLTLVFGLIDKPALIPYCLIIFNNLVISLSTST